MKTKLFSLFVALIATMSVYAYDFKYGDLYYNIKDDGTVEVTYPSGQSSDNYSGLTSVVIPESVTYNGTTYRVTSIGNSAFQYCSGLTSVTIPNSVTSIGYAAFYDCIGLTSITIPNSVTSIGNSAFQYCSGLTSVTIPNSVTSIGEWAFSNCSGLTSVTIPNSVTSIGGYAFYACSGLTSITIPNSVTSIGYSAFRGCRGLTSVTIPNSVTNIGESAFTDVPNIVYFGTAEGAPWGARSMNGYVDGYLVYSDATKTNLLACSSAATGIITVPNNVTTIGESAFEDCSGLTSVTIGNNVTTIGESAFEDCSGLTSITIPNSVTSIGESAFQYCSGLTTVIIGNSVTTIGDCAFRYCGSLETVIIGNSVTTIGEVAFAYCENLFSITIPNSVTSIGGGAFQYCSALTSILIGNSITSIGEYAFLFCTSLTSITIPNSVTSIGENVFSYCTNLTSVTIPSCVTTMGGDAFLSCSSLTVVTCYAIEPPTINGSSLVGDRSDSISLYVLEGSVEKYKAAEGWKDFKEILPISAMPADADEPVLNPEENKVTITWPATDKAATYTIEISKDGTLVCTLTFDANGVLKNMRFAAPSRYAAQHTTQAEATGSGFRFVVEGLDYATTYTYRITAKDADDKVVESYNGTFTTTSPTSTEDVHSTQSQPETRKVFRNGQMYIIRGEKTYTATGSQL